MPRISPALRSKLISCRSACEPSPRLDGDAFQAEQRRRRHGGFVSRVKPLQPLARHRRDQPVLVELGALELGRDTPVAENGRPVAQRHHLGQPMGNEDRGGALPFEPPQQAEEARHLGAGERGGRLIEHQQSRPRRKGPYDHDQVTLSRRQRGHERTRVERQPEIPKQRRRASLQPPVVDENSAA